MRSLLALCLVTACTTTSDEAPPTNERAVEFSETVFADGQYVKVGSRAHVIGDTLDVTRANDGIVAVSTDGENWTETEFPASGHLWDVAFGDGRWIVVGSDLVANPSGGFSDVRLTLTAPTGGAWEPFADPPGRTSSIEYGAGRWVSAGTGGLAQSADGATWTPVPDTATLWHGPKVAFVRELFVAFGEGGGLLESADGVTWAAFDTQLTMLTHASDTGSTIVVHGYYDCCFGEVPDAVEYFAVTRNSDGTWSILAE